MDTHQSKEGSESLTVTQVGNHDRAAQPRLGAEVGSMDWPGAWAYRSGRAALRPPLILKSPWSSALARVSCMGFEHCQRTLDNPRTLDKPEAIPLAKPQCRQSCQDLPIHRSGGIRNQCFQLRFCVWGSPPCQSGNFARRPSPEHIHLNLRTIFRFST